MALNHTASRQERGYGRQWEKVRLHVLRRDDGICQPCLMTGRYTPASQVDHIIPKASGGTDDPDNLQSICGTCHFEKTAREAAEAQGRTYRPRRSIGVDGWPE